MRAGAAQRTVGGAWLALVGMFLAQLASSAGCYLVHEREDDADTTDAPSCPVEAQIVVPAGSCVERVLETGVTTWPCSAEPRRGSFVRIDNESSRIARVEAFSASRTVTSRLCIAELGADCRGCLEANCLEGPVGPGEGGIGVWADERAGFVVHVSNDGEPVRLVACDLFP